MLLGFSEVSNAFIQSEVPGSARQRPGHPEKEKLHKEIKPSSSGGGGRERVRISLNRGIIFRSRLDDTFSLQRSVTIAPVAL